MRIETRRLANIKKLKAKRKKERKKKIIKPWHETMSENPKCHLQHCPIKYY
jgi:hypothetical protein